MKLIYKGEFSGNVDDIPHGEHKPGAVMFKEPTDIKKFSLIMNIAAFILTVILVVIYVIRSESELAERCYAMLIGCGLSILSLFPHELLHAICFKGTVYLYTNFKQGMFFVTGPEDMSKARFIFLSMLPNLVFGFIPFIIFLVFPRFIILGALGAIAIGMGAGDYMNVFNAITQMPKGARTYVYSFNSYWYMP